MSIRSRTTLPHHHSSLPSPFAPASTDEKYKPQSLANKALTLFAVCSLLAFVVYCNAAWIAGKGSVNASEPQTGWNGVVNVADVPAIIIFENEGGKILPPLASVSSIPKNKASILPPISPPAPKTPKTLTSPASHNVHVVFSTDCGTYQQWQSYLLFHSAYLIKQPGSITRIMSGCDAAQKGEMQLWHDTYIKTISDKFYVHFTPKFDVNDEGKTYLFFNKPFGLHHWLTHALPKYSNGRLMDEDVMIAIMDPDQIFVRRLINDFFDVTKHIVPYISKHDVLPKKVTHGFPFGQHYGLGSQWRTFNLTKITGDDKSPSKSVSVQDANKYYPVGPPFMGTARDMLSLSTKWSEFAKPVNIEYPHLLGEMYAYCIAAAHLELKHTMLDDFMVSNVDAGGEGWGFVDSFDKVCDADNLKNADSVNAPTVLHYCQSYRIGEFGFHKKKVPKGFMFTCDMPLLVEPPVDLGEAFDYKTQGPKNGKKREDLKLTKVKAKREGFMICTILRSLNEAARFYKSRHCGGKESNLEQTLRLIDPKNGVY